jgi:hypothetical protein
MQRIRISIDPLLTEKYYSEVSWTWRFLLSGMGISWEEVSWGETADIVYAVDPGSGPRGSLIVQARLPFWEDPSHWKLASVSAADGFSHPVFEGVVEPSPAWETADGRTRVYHDVIFDIFWLLTGQEEASWPRDKHGWLNLSNTVHQREKLLLRGLVSEIGCWLEQQVSGMGFTLLPRWPGGRKAAACVGHDVDYPEIVRWLEPARILMGGHPQRLAAASAVLFGRRHNWHFREWVELEKRWGPGSAFYFVPRKGSIVEYVTTTPDPFYDVGSPRFRDLFRMLADEGFEIGMHASYRACESVVNFRREKEHLERASGGSVDGNRHHYWHVDPLDPEGTLLMHEQAGFRYDSSLVHECYLGWRRSSSWPFFPFLQKQKREIRTLQIPTGWMDIHAFRHAADNPGIGIQTLTELAGTVARQSGCLMLDIHDCYFDDFLYPGYLEMYEKLWDHVFSTGLFWMARPIDIANHWIARYNSILGDSRGLATGE